MKYFNLKTLKRIWVFAGICFTAWLFYSMQAHDVEPRYFESDSQIAVRETDDFISFSPNKNSEQVLIFFPGALVAPDAYVPLCHQSAENGIETYLIKMPWRQARLGYTKIKDLDILKNKTKKYTLAGHSQGGKMVAQFVYENPGLIDKAILIATTHPKDIDLSKTGTQMMKIYGDRDGVAEEAGIEANKLKLPVSTNFIKIAGANHAQFGYYGFQLGDNSASISREEQQKQTLLAILGFVKESK